MKNSNANVRSLKEGYGVQGVVLNLSLAHIYSLAMLKMECEAAMSDSSTDPRAKNLAQQTKGILDLIIGDIATPFDTDLWSNEKSEKKADNEL